MVHGPASVDATDLSALTTATQGPSECGLVLCFFQRLVGSEEIQLLNMVRAFMRTSRCLYTHWGLPDPTSSPYLLKYILTAYHINLIMDSEHALVDTQNVDTTQTIRWYKNAEL